MIRRKPVSSQPRPVAHSDSSDGHGSLEQRGGATEQFSVDLSRDASNTISRKPLSRTSTCNEQFLRGPPDLTFAWGAKPQASIASEFCYFMSVRGITSSTPPLSLRKLAKELNPARIKRVLAAAVGPESDCYAAWRTPDGECKWILRRSPQPSLLDKAARRKWLASRASISALENWLVQNLTNTLAVLTSRVVLGPEGSYFASYLSAPTDGDDPERVATWQNMPFSFFDLVDKRTALRGSSESVPAMVALGVENAWVAVWYDKQASWDLAGRYDALAHQLEARDGKGIETIFLSAIEPDQYYVQFADRVAYLSAPILKNDLELINACLISSLLNTADTSSSPSTSSPSRTSTSETLSKSPPPYLLAAVRTPPTSQAFLDEPIIIPSPLPGVLNVSVISDRDFHSPFVSLPTIPPIPRSKLKFAHFAKPPEGVKNTWGDATESVAANVTQATNCPVM